MVAFPAAVSLSLPVTVCFQERATHHRESVPVLDVIAAIDVDRLFTDGFDAVPVSHDDNVRIHA